MSFIVKIQKPIVGNDRHPCLVYNEDRSVMTHADLLQLFDEHEYKIYHRAHLEGTILHIDERVEDQDF